MDVGTSGGIVLPLVSRISKSVPCLICGDSILLGDWELELSVRICTPCREAILWTRLQKPPGAILYGISGGD
jgi:hypothetical protein